jgi:methionyl-tRNA formyltransferase
MHPMRVIFMGTPEFAVPVLEALVEAGHDVVAAYSQPPRAGGRRGKALTPSPVHARAEELGIAVRTPLSFRKDPEALAAFEALAADVAVVAAYGLILPQAVLDAPKHGCLNVHGSLLSRWRGAAPVRLEERTPVDGKTAGDLTTELSAMGARLMVAVLADLDGHPAVAQPQEGVTYAAKIDKAEARLDFHETAEQVLRRIRAFNPAPGAWFEVNGERIRILEAEAYGRVRACAPSGVTLDDRLRVKCGEWTSIRPLRVQRAGRGVMTLDELLRGFPIPEGTHL